MDDWLTTLPKAHSQLLAWLSEKDGDWYQAQAAQSAGVNKATANLALARFAHEGIVNRQRKGRMWFYRRNDENPLLRQYKILRTVHRLQSTLTPLRRDAHLIILFGSAADGTNGEHSDVDLLVVTENKEINLRPKGQPPLQILSYTPAEYARLSIRDPALYNRIQRGIPLYQRPPATD